MPVGIIVWSTVAWQRDAFILLGYVDPKHRGRGIYTALYRRLVEIARQAGLRTVSGTVAYRNTAMRAVAERQGRTPIAVTFSEEL